MHYTRYDHVAVLLKTGKVLLAGGYSSSDAQETAELYDPRTEIWTTTYNMNYKRQGPTASLLSNGRVLVTSGWSGSANLDTAELYEP